MVTTRTKPSPPSVQEMTLFPGIDLTFELVDPARADELLAHNTRNRLLHAGAVEAYGRSMVDGEWAFAGDPIRVADDGTLLDGQHRLNAIVKSGQPQWMIIIHGLPLATQAKIDVGRKRDVAQQLAMQGIPNASAVAATARLYMTWMHWIRHRTAVQWTNPQVTAFAMDRIDYIHPATHAAQSARRELPVSGPAVASAYMRAAEITDVFRANEWFERLATGTDLSIGDPIHSLRRSLLLDKDNKGAIRGHFQLYKIVRAWNADAKGEALRSMQPPKDGVNVSTFRDMIPGHWAPEAA